MKKPNTLTGIVIAMLGSGIAVGQTAAPHWIRPGGAHIGSDAAGALPAEGPVPPGFRGTLTYEGTLEGKVTVRDRSRDVRVNIGGFRMDSAGTRDVPVQAAYRLDLTFDGDRVTGSEQRRSDIRGAAGNSSWRGFRRGEACDIVDEVGHRIVAHCSAGEFAATMDYVNAQGQHGVYSLQARRTRFVDFVERDRQAELAKVELANRRAWQQDQTRAQLAQRNPDYATLSSYCDDGNGWVCEAVGEYFGDRGPHFDRSRAQSLFEKACNLNNYTGCSNYAAVNDDKGSHQDQLDKAERFARIACENSVASGCKQEAFYLYKRSLWTVIELFDAKISCGQNCKYKYVSDFISAANDTIDNFRQVKSLDPARSADCDKQIAELTKLRDEVAAQ